MDTCVVCRSGANLNTQMTITIDNDKIVVALCDEHAEDTTVKVAKEKYLERKKQIEELLIQAKALGLDISNMNNTSNQTKLTPPPTNSNISPEEKETTQSKAKIINQSLQNTESDKDWISTDKYNNVQQAGFTSVGGQGAQSYSSYKVSGQQDTLDSELLEGKIKMDVVEGRGGQPLPIPSKRVDGTGTTTIRVVKSENDQSLQRRFKDMASQEHQPDFRHGYNDATRTCPICRGDCSVNGKDCPKCKGSGLISVY